MWIRKTNQKWQKLLDSKFSQRGLIFNSRFQYFEEGEIFFKGLIVVLV